MAAIPTAPTLTTTATTTEFIREPTMRAEARIMSRSGHTIIRTRAAATTQFTASAQLISRLTAMDSCTVTMKGSATGNGTVWATSAGADHSGITRNLPT